MKKSALLAVSALSLGVVGLATFTPMVNAATSVSGDATVSVMVDESFGMGGDTDIDGDGTVNMDQYDVTFDSINAGEVATEKTIHITTQNNTSKRGKLTIAAKTVGTEQSTAGALKNGDNEIISTATAPVAGTSTWGYKTTGDYQAVTTTPATLADSLTGSQTTDVTFGVSTSNVQASGNYSGDVTYTFAVSE